MKVIFLILLSQLITLNLSAATKYKCRKNRTLVSCKGIEDAHRKAFCIKGDITEEKRKTYCQKPPKVKKQ